MTILDIVGVIFTLSWALTPVVFLVLFEIIDNKEDSKSKKNDGSRIKSRFPKN